MKSIVSLSSIALISLVSAAPVVAATLSTEQTPMVERAISISTEPIKVAGFWDKILNTGIDMVGDEIQRKQREAAAAAKREAAAAATKAAGSPPRIKQKVTTPSHQGETAISVQARTPEDVQQARQTLFLQLNRQTGEGYEAWHRRIDNWLDEGQFTDSREVRSAKIDDYRAWRSALPADELQAFDNITKQENARAHDRLNDTISDTIFGGGTSESGNSNNGCPQGQRPVYRNGSSFCY